MLTLTSITIGNNRNARLRHENDNNFTYTQLYTSSKLKTIQVITNMFLIAIT